MHQAAHAALVDSDHDDHFHRYDSHDLYEHRRHSAYTTDLTLNPSLTNRSQRMERPRPHSIDNPHPHHQTEPRDRHSPNQWNHFRETSGQLLQNIETHQRLEQCSRLRAKAARDTLLPVPPPPRRIPVILRHMETPFLIRSEKKVPHGGLPFHVFQSYECLYGTLQMQAAALFPKLDVPSDPAEGVVCARVVLVDGVEEREECRAEWGLECEELRAGVYDRVYFDFLAGKKERKMVSKERSLDEKTQIVTTRLRDGRNERENPSLPKKNAWSSGRRLLGALGRKFRSSCCSSPSCLDDDAGYASAREDGAVEEKANLNHEVGETAHRSSSASALKTARDPTHLRQRRKTVCAGSMKATTKTQRPSRTTQGRPGEETPLLSDSDRLQMERGAKGQKQNLERNLLTREEKRTRYHDCRYGYPYFL
ncbi:hypothetical protein KC318_g13678 [Hortaea werneckii]|nr:hypothetical protein KC334_g13862 [Hortaea werneckii]KAI6953331.1 hypothetical protein KC355_g13786 [Hortaea werneckii]KAI7654301.1 hypothetical protein KC318_g13678 [Hortaea werneckii]